MIVYPLIEIQNGECVGLDHGRLDRPKVYDAHPVEAAQGFIDEGAQWIQVTDLDALADRGDNSELIKRIVRETRGSVQVSGGIRTMAQVEEWLDFGAGRVAIGGAAIKEPDFIRAAARRFAEQIVLNINARGGKVMAAGRAEPTAFEPIEFATYFENCALAAIIFRDLDLDDDQPLESFAATTDLSTSITTPLISSGLVKSLDDISRLRFMPNIAGVMLCRPLFQKKLRLADVIELAGQVEGPTPDFAQI